MKTEIIKNVSYECLVLANRSKAATLEYLVKQFEFIVCWFSWIIAGWINSALVLIENTAIVGLRKYEKFALKLDELVE